MGRSKNELWQSGRVVGDEGAMVTPGDLYISDVTQWFSSFGDNRHHYLGSNGGVRPCGYLDSWPVGAFPDPGQEAQKDMSIFPRISGEWRYSQPVFD